MLLIGHRGAVDSSSPENTLVAVDRALRHGADGVEVDVRLTADGHVVCHHDPDFARTAAVRRDVADTPLAELPTVVGHPVPSLHQVLDLVGRRGRVVVELKVPAWPLSAKGALVSAVAEVLTDHPRSDVTVSSFDRSAVRLVRRRELVPTALLGRPRMPLSALVHRAYQDGHHEVHAHLSSLRPGAELPPALELVVWTVDRPWDLRRAAAAGAGAVICDDPLRARHVLRRTNLLVAVG